MLKFLLDFFQIVVSLYQDASHNLDVFVSVIWIPLSHIATCVQVIGVSSCAKSNPWVTRTAVIIFVANNTNSGFRMFAPTTNGIEPFLVAVVLQRGLWAN